jgi:hypothetical protein
LAAARPIAQLICSAGICFVVPISRSTARIAAFGKVHVKKPSF